MKDIDINAIDWMALAEETESLEFLETLCSEPGYRGEEAHRESRAYLSRFGGESERS